MGNCVLCGLAEDTPPAHHSVTKESFQVVQRSASLSSQVIECYRVTRRECFGDSVLVDEV